MDILENIEAVISFIAANLKAEYVALFSVLVTIIIYILNNRSELKFKKYESRRHEYAKLISLLSIAFTNPKKLEPDKNGNINKEVQENLFEVGSSLMLYASKKLYKEYIFFRDFSTGDHIKLSKYYDPEIITYIVANIMRQIRKEVGLSTFNQISATESLGFFINNFATNPIQKNKAHLMNYKIRMIKLELFFMNRYHGVFINWCFYNLIKPIGGIIRCIITYLIIIPLIHLKNKIMGNSQQDNSNDIKKKQEDK